MAQTIKPKPIIALRGYTRSGSFPLDNTSFFDSYVEAIEYVQTSKIVYPGQIISVDDPVHKKARVYQVSYDNEPNALHKYFLEEISLGSNSFGYFKFKGKLNTLDDLYALTDMKNNDLYFVNVGNDENNLPVYEAYVYVNEWSKIDLGVTIASRTNDGLITKELWQRLASIDQETSGILYHPGYQNVHIEQGRESTPEDAHFIPFETDGESNPKLQSADRLKKTIYNIMQAKSPYVKLTINYDFSKCYIGQEFTNVELDVEFFHHLAGQPYSAEFLSNIPSITNNNIKYDFFDFEYDKDKMAYKLKDTIIIPYINIESLLEEDNIIQFTVYYENNMETLWEDGYVTEKVDIKVFDSLLYQFGHYSVENNDIVLDHSFEDDKSNLIKLGDKIELSLQPNENGICYFELSSPYQFTKVIYKNQNDENFLDLLSVSYNSEDSRYYYRFQGYSYYPIKNRLDFIIET